MADKTSEYPEKTVFNDNDLMDISSFQDVGSYVSEKSTLLQVVDYIKTKVGIYGVDGTIGTGRVATLTDSLSFVKDAVTALFISKDFVGIGTSSPAANLDLITQETVGVDPILYVRNGQAANSVKLSVITDGSFLSSGQLANSTMRGSNFVVRHVNIRLTSFQLDGYSAISQGYTAFFHKNYGQAQNRTGSNGIGCDDTNPLWNSYAKLNIASADVSIFKAFFANL